MKIEGISLNLLLANTLCSNEKVLGDIDKIYSTKPKEYYRAYRENEEIYAYYEDAVPAKYFDYYEKMAGIIEYAESKRQYVNVYSIIKKAYPDIFKAVKNSRVLSTQKVFELIYKDGKMDESEFEYYDKMIVMLFVKDAEFISSRKQTVIALEEEIKNEISNHLKRQTIALTKGKNNIFNDMSNLLFDKGSAHPVMAELKEYCNPHVAFGRITARKLEEKYYKSHEDYERSSIADKYEKRAKLLRSGDAVSTHAALYHFLNRYGFMEHFLNIDFNLTDIKNINELITDLKNEYNYPIDEENMMIISGVLAAVLKENKQMRPLLKKAKVEYFDFEKEKQLKELNQQVEVTQQSKKELESSLRLQINNLQKALDESNSKNKQLEKELTLAQNEINEFADKDIELQKLRETIFNLSDDSIEEEPKLDKKMETIKYLKTKKLVFIGGHENWVEKMKEALPEAIFYDVEAATNRSLSALKNADFVVFNTRKNSHGAYYRVLSNLEDKNKLVFANAISIDKALSEIKEAMNK